ncbi:MAG: hypothetical protein RLZZ608_1270 [Actinomycetota bacterium]
MKLVNQGRQAELFEIDDGVLLKLFFDRHTSSRDVEWRALTGIRAGLGPVVFEQREVLGRSGFTLERLPGSDMLAVIGSRPWLLFRVGLAMGRIHAEIHGEKGEAHLPDYRDVMSARILHSQVVPDHVREPALATLERQPAGTQLCHGDLHPGNVMWSSGTSRVLDWPAAARGNPVADVATTLTILRLGEPTETSPWVIRRLHRLGRGALISRYLAGYRTQRPINEAELHEWMLPAAVDRLAHDIPSERMQLLTTIDALLPRHGATRGEGHS